MICRVYNGKEVTTMDIGHYLKIASAIFSICTGLCQAGIGVVSLRKELTIEATQEATTDEE